MSHVVGPVIARDTQVMETYLGPISTDVPSDTSIRTGSISQASHKPIYHVPIPPRRPSPAAQCSCSRNLPLELVNQVDPYLDRLVAMYFEHLYPAFPVLEEECMASKLTDRQTIPRTFLVNFVAFALFYWDMGSSLLLHARPDQDFAWSVASQAMIADIQKGDLAAITSTIFNVAGRPSKSFVSNMTSVSRIVALSHSCGLNHDCREWKIADYEKRFRWKVWWAILIHDRWLNFAQGTPPHINKAHYDVPMPTIELLAGSRINIEKHHRAAQCYIELCKLTEIIGDVLPLIYHIRSGNDGLAAEQTSRSEIDLNRWNHNRPRWLDYTDFENRPDVPGLVNLQLSYLAVRMLLRRIAWHEICQRESDPSSAWLESCLDAAENIVRLVCSLRKSDLAGFWLPYNAHHFASTVTLLLRCGLQTRDAFFRRRSMSSARTLVDCLRRYKDEYNWDMAETALVQSESILKRIEDALRKRTTPPTSRTNSSTVNGTGTATASASTVPPATSTSTSSSTTTSTSTPIPRATSQPANTATTTPNGTATTTTNATTTAIIDDTFWDNPMLQYPGFGWSGQPEELFPGLFSDFSADAVVFEGLSTVS